MCNASPSHPSAEEMVLFEVTYIDDDSTLVKNSYCIEDEQQSHSALHSEPSMSAVTENLTKNCGTHLLNVAEKRKLVLTPSTEEEPAQKRIYIEASCNSVNYKSEDIKTEFSDIV